MFVNVVAVRQRQLSCKPEIHSGTVVSCFNISMDKQEVTLSMVIATTVAFQQRNEDVVVIDAIIAA